MKLEKLNRYNIKRIIDGSILKKVDRKTIYKMHVNEDFSFAFRILRQIVQLNTNKINIIERDKEDDINETLETTR